MKAEDEPWTVTADYDNLKIVLTAKDVKDRDNIQKKLRWTVVFRRIRKDLKNPSVCFIKCKSEKELEKKLAIMLTTMNMLRIKLK